MSYNYLFIFTLLCLFYNVYGYSIQNYTECTNIINYIIKEYDYNDSTIYDLIHLIQNICLKIVGTNNMQCSFIVENVHKISQLITNHSNSTVICDDIFFS